MLRVCVMARARYSVSDGIAVVTEEAVVADDCAGLASVCCRVVCSLAILV